MAGRLAGKRALVTAAGQGIGRATALAFADEGATVYATDLDPGKLTELAGHANIASMKLDCLDPAAIQAIAKELGTLDIVFNCAGFVHNGTILEATEEEWAFAFDLNVRSVFRVIRAFLPAMLDKGAGSIVNIASIASSLKGVPNRAIYGATKASVIGLTKSVAADFVGRGIRCNAICPGTVHTPSLDDRINAAPDPVQARKDFVARQPMGRLGKAEEIAGLAVYLASDESVFVTGQAYVIDGGILI
ncbi:SDR family oxidoreductase [Desertibaculum subflavum]|uniref:SDR family oxidoreductase n=1 Tax=Desertibaculum subflavum TaxID=2268458 RepID=UPI000E67166B